LKGKPQRVEQNKEWPGEGDEDDERQLRLKHACAIDNWVTPAMSNDTKIA